MRYTFRWTVLTGFFLLAAATPLWSQRVTGTISGRVTDNSGAVLPQATVTVLNTLTQEERKTATDEAGSYSVPSLPPGAYTVSAELTGFKKGLRQNVVLQVADEARVDIALEVGEITETVSVTEDAARVQSESASVGQVIDHRKIVDLPLNGRNFVQLAAISAGASPLGRNSGVTSFNGQRENQSVNISGQREVSNTFALDGVHNGVGWFGEVSILVSVDAIQEFNVQRNFFSAEYGTPAYVNIASRSGTNQFHGTAFHFLRNDNLDARNFFDRRKPEFKLNQFGYSLGGPIIREKTWFFSNYEGLRSRRGISQIHTIPTDDIKNGDFSYLLPATQIVDPVTGVPFPGNLIPQNRMSRVARNLLPYYPAPSLPGRLNNLNVALARPDDFDQITERVDHHFSDRDRLFGRYTWHDSIAISPNIGMAGRISPKDGKNATIQETHVFSNNKVNELRLGYNYSLLFDPIPEPTGGKDLGAEVGLKNIEPPDPGGFGIPSLQVRGFSSIGPSILRSGTTNHKIQVQDTLNWNRGKHQMFMGGDIIRWRYHHFNQFGERSSLIFNRAFSGNDFADFLLGSPSQTQQMIGSNDGNMRSTYWSFFFQDNIKVTPRLTLNLGLRYEYRQPFVEINDKLGILDYTVPGAVLRTPVNQFPFSDPRFVTGGIPRGIYEPDRNNWAPRFGFAYSPTGSQTTVIRGGVGVYYDLTALNEFSFVTSSLPHYFLDTRVYLAPTVFLDELFPPFDPNAIPVTFSFFNSDFVDRTPYAMQWNLNIQQKLSPTLLFEVGYFGSGGRKQSQRYDINAPEPVRDANDLRTLQERRPFPGWGQILTSTLSASSSYHAMQARLEKSFSQGLSFLGVYTFGKSLDHDPSGSFGTTNQNPSNRQADWARSTYDVRHRLVVSYNYDLPVGRHGKFLSGVTGLADKLLTGWQMNGISVFSGGVAYDVTAINGVGGFSMFRADRTCDGNLPSSERTPQRWFDTSCFSQPIGPDGRVGTRYGNSARSVIEADGIHNWDFSIFKNTYIKENLNLQFRAEFFNLFNHTQFGAPTTSVASPVNGQVLSAARAREVQFGFKVVF
jgi:Carboxypeptidase regulatory-like domain/TonB dependent receptor-like, beta-barrel